MEIADKVIEFEAQVLRENMYWDSGNVHTIETCRDAVAEKLVQSN